MITNYTTRTLLSFGCPSCRSGSVPSLRRSKPKTRTKISWKPQAGFEPTTFRLLSECSTPKLLWLQRSKLVCTSCRPYGPMDKAPAYGAGDSGFESQYGLVFFVFFCLTFLLHQVEKERGDARIELATSCTRSRNHTTRPITQLLQKSSRDVLELNQRPIGLQPIALPLS